MNKSNELSNHIDEVEEGECGYSFDSKTKKIKVFRYHDTRANSYWNLPESLCSSKSILNIQSGDNFSFLWCVLAQLHEVDIHRGRVAHIKNTFKNSITVMYNFL